MPPLAPTNSKLRDAAWAIDVALIVGLCWLLAGTPPPETNEAHYLAKAKHYWNPSWCAGDLFLESADAHLVFYWTFGWLTRLFSLPTVAWIGRFIGWILLACSWRSFSYTLVPRPYFAVLSAAAFQLFLSRCNAGGEWALGGVEAKVIAYALMFWGLAALVRGQWRAVWLWLGASSAFHVLVGGWAVLIALGVWLTLGKSRPRLASLLGPLALGFVLSLPGLLPALALTWNVNRETVREASVIYVYERLSHHLLPSDFDTGAILRHLALLVTWLILCVEPAASSGQRILRRFVAGAMLCAALGVAWELLAQGNKELTAAVLRYYLFRMSDVMLPAGVALESTALLSAWSLNSPRGGRVAIATATLLLVAALGPSAWRAGHDGWSGADRQSAMEDLGSWREMCDWIAENTPADAKFLSPRDHFTFKWYAGRAEVVNWKDVPQDARALVEWKHAQNDIWALEKPALLQRWYLSITERSDEDILALAQRYGFRYVVVERATAVRDLRFREVYPNQDNVNTVYQVFELPDVQKIAKP